MSSLLLAGESAGDLAVTKLEPGLAVPSGGLTVTPTLVNPGRRRRLVVQVGATFASTPAAGGAIYVWPLRRHTPATGGPTWDSGSGATSVIQPVAYAFADDARSGLTINESAYYFNPSSGTNFTNYPADGKGFQGDQQSDWYLKYTVPSGVTSLRHVVRYKTGDQYGRVHLVRQGTGGLANRTGTTGHQVWDVTTAVSAGWNLILTDDNTMSSGGTTYLDSWEIYAVDSYDYPTYGVDQRPAGPPEVVLPVTPGVAGAITRVLDLLTDRPVRLAVENGCSTAATVTVSAQWAGDAVE